MSQSSITDPTERSATAPSQLKEGEGHMQTEPVSIDATQSQSNHRPSSSSSSSSSEEEEEGEESVEKVTTLLSENVQPSTFEHHCGTILVNEPIDNTVECVCECPLLTNDNLGDDEGGDRIDGPHTPEAWDVPFTRSNKRLMNMPASIFEQLPGYYWHGMEEILEEEGVELVLPWSVLDPGVFELD